ncbi:hypothetical protein V6Z12_D13G116500 [Gossypium hirsutum]
MPTDNPSLQISPVKLDRNNYLTWSRSCLLFIKACELQGYITGKTTKLELTNSIFKKELVFYFLAGLNIKYDQIWVQVLSKTPFSSIHEAYSYVQQEESRRVVMLYNHLLRKLTSLLTRMVHRVRKKSTSAESFTSDEIQHLRRLLSQMDSTSIAKSNHAKSSTVLNARSTSEFWIIDSGANRHMTRSNKSLFKYTTCPSKDTVQIADGSLTSVSGTSSVVCTPNITLSSVFYVPKFPFNLLSVSTNTTALNCKLEFFLDHCVFQDLQTGRTIHSGRLWNGFYLMDRSSSISQALFGDNKDVNREIIQWHKQLGHPSFTVAKMFPTLFSRSQLDSLVYNACEVAKHARHSYPLRNNSIVPSEIIHSDVWGPTHLTSLSGNQWFVTFIDHSLLGEFSLPKFATDLELPIAQRKGVRTCTLHLIS